MDMLNYYHDTHSLPQYVVVDISFEVRRIQSFFGRFTEDIVRRIIDAVGDRHAYSYNVSRMTSDLFDGMYTARMLQEENPTLRRIGLFDMMITIEQMALSIQDKLAQHNLYLIKQFLPYLYEHTLSDGSVALTKLSFEDFCDAYCVELNS